MSDELFLIDDELEENSGEKWNILIVDDEASVHTITNAALKNMKINNKRLNILNAMSVAEAKEILHKYDDIALALIDVVMETPEAGLDLVNYIRNDMKNKMIRLVLRTGQPSQAPQRDLIDCYDINDYKEKTELTVEKLYILVRTSVKQYEQYQELKANRDTIYKKMTTSELTGLPNRMKLNENLDREGSKSLILINIDDFSVINDRHGFDVGDKLLQSFAEYINSSYSDCMELFHINADVFVLLCNNLNSKNIVKCMEDLKTNITSRHFKLGIIEQQIGVSIGIAMNESGNLIQKAELAIKEARNTGKNNTQIYADDLKIIRTIESNSLWTQRIRKAIKEKRVHAYFQAIQEFKTQKIVKYEALVRIEHEGEVYSPFHFLDAAQYSGQIYDIFKIMFKKTCELAKTSEYDFSVNMSESDLHESDFFDYIKQTLKESKISPDRITLEILEYKSIAGDNYIKNLINALHDFGLKISIDDFGAQCSNFSQLNNIHIDYIKIDGSFIKDIIQNKNSQIVSRTIIDYAHQKNISVIAEFVCNREIYNYLKMIGADYAQGYFIAKPLPII
ncbi:MAG: EAL domain-containing protein [Sulfurimonas sp.]|nr:EAL domain-containing protein [Sulfurimonas sp.]